MIVEVSNFSDAVILWGLNQDTGAATGWREKLGSGECLRNLLTKALGEIQK